MCRNRVQRRTFLIALPAVAGVLVWATLPSPAAAQLADPPRQMLPATLLPPDVEWLPPRTVPPPERLSAQPPLYQPVAPWEAPPPGNPWCEPPWSWQLLPDGILYPAYLAGTKESRMASVWAYERNAGWLWDVTLGGRVGILRFGSTDSERPRGWQLDLEGAGFPRLDLEQDRDLLEADFRFGIPLTYATERWHAKLAYYHLSSHVGDELLVRDPTVGRINYVRDVLLLGAGWYLTDDVRLYGEVGYGFYTKGGSQPWELQFGAEYSPRHTDGARGSPFAAINSRLRQEVNFGGNLVVQAGWQWRGSGNSRLLRVGGQYFNGQTDQYEFFRTSEQQLGMGLWFDY